MTAIFFKLTERERQLIEQKMALAGVHNMSAYIRKMCIDGYTINLQIPELQECSRYLQSASNNVNQIAKRLNSGGRYYARELAEVENCLQENKKLYPEQKRQRAKMLELLTARSNVERILGLQNVERQREKQLQQER